MRLCRYRTSGAVRKTGQKMSGLSASVDPYGTHGN